MALDTGEVYFLPISHSAECSKLERSPDTNQASHDPTP